MMKKAVAEAEDEWNILYNLMYLFDYIKVYLLEK